MEKVLELNDLHISFHTYSGEIQAVRGVNLTLQKGETLAIVGESGSGKSVTSKEITRLNPRPQASVKQGEINFDGRDLVHCSNKTLEQIRGKEISMIFQDPMTTLNPTMTIGKQIIEGLRKHQNIRGHAAKERAIELLNLVKIPNAEARFKQYPHQFSGGMRQRAVIATALACNPKVLIADEPTTALDVTIQAQILELLRSIQEELGTSIIIITHDLGVVANIAHRVAVMYGGKLIETGLVDEVFFEPVHPYTWGLLSSMPQTNKTNTRLPSIPGTPPDLSNPPKGCPFAPRCAYAMQNCVEEMPESVRVTDTHEGSCWLMDERAPHVEIPEPIREMATQQS